jgi:hypothetical protein
VFCDDDRVVDEKERDGDNDKNHVEDTSGCEKLLGVVSQQR